MQTPNDPLDALLDRWRHIPTPSHQLRAKIWRRIEAAERVRARAPGRLEPLFAQPAFAALFVAACVLLGLFLAETRLTRLHADRSAQIAQSYLRLIDPSFGANSTAAPAQRP